MADLAEQVIKSTSGLADDFRRRVMAGAMLLGSLVYAYLKGSQTSGLAVNASLLGSATFAIVSVAAVYITGALVEIVGEVLLVRIAGNYLWAFFVPFTWFADRRGVVRYVLRSLFWPAALILAFYYVARSLLGRSDFRWLSSKSSVLAGNVTYNHCRSGCRPDYTILLAIIKN
jgi:hypothetical protein